MTLLLGGIPVTAQLSPGELAEPHAHLEGLKHCQDCHAVGSDAFRDQCLSCHKPLAERIRQGKGFHAAPERQTCQTCHSDHHGKTFALIHWPNGMEQFDHAATGFRLSDAHAAASCRSCHKAALIPNVAGLKAQGLNLERTFLGLSRDCASCHQDPHRNQLGSSCGSCHSAKAWSPATGFDHAKAGFALKGAHGKVACKTCHPSTTEGGKTLVRYKPIASAACRDCHQDVHQGTTDPRCETCHNDQQFTPATLFDHQQTRFPLTGKHKNTACRECHTSDSKANLIFSRSSTLPTCTTCHSDPHDQRLGSDCSSCHNTAGWDQAVSATFDHRKTRYPLTGKHRSLDCERCHSKGLQIPGFQSCITCHRDVHQNQFSVEAYQDGCQSCHDTAGFVPSHFGTARHSETRFPLKGAHLATPCFACHTAPQVGKPVSYHFKGLACKACHEDIHRGAADAWMADGDCTACHEDSSWSTLHFDHARTSFPLEAAHAKLLCGTCHVKDNGTPKLKNLTTTCEGCHRDPHQAQFAQAGQTDCARCHAPQTWAELRFDHAQTRFPIDGAHASVTCAACHPSVTQAGKTLVRYTPIDPACVTCHATSPREGRNP